MKASALPSKAPPRLASIDAYRGFVMFLMLAEVLRLCEVSQALPDSGFWRLLCHHQSHAQWVGCSLHDLIQPGFFFLVGVALVFSAANRRTRGQGSGVIFKHAAARAILLVLLGISIESLHPRQLTWSFADTLAQIGLSYGFAFLISLRPVRDWWIAFGLLLAGYWLAFALYPLPPSEFNYARVGVTADWLREHGLTGFAAHWQKNSNLAWAFDIWFLNLVPFPGPFTHHRLGLATLNFIPTIGTMILGLAAGRVLHSESPPWNKVRWLAVAGVTGLAGGWLLGALGVCPVVKSIWTPSWVLFSGGWCFLLLTAFYVLVDLWQQKWMVFPLVVVGMNSIAAYCGSHFYSAVAFNGPRRILGRDVFRLFGDAYEPLVYGSLILLGYWLGLFLMYRRRVFLKI